MATPKKRDVHIFLDTNIIRSESVTEIVKEEVVQAIHMYNSYPDLRLHWVIPDLVRMERKDQMQRKANSHLSSFNILENLFDSDWLVNEESISTQIDRVIADQIKKLKITIQDLDINSPDWNLIISNAAFKVPPFSDSEKEKGFKDAIILETFKQYISKVRARSKSHLICFLTNDKLLRLAAIDSTKEDKFIQVFEGIEDFKNQVNQYSSKVTSEFADELVQKGAELFFQKDNLDTLYYKNEIGKQIVKSYKAKLTELNNGATSSSISKNQISKTIFVKKDGARVYFSTRIQYTINNSIEVPKKPVFSTRSTPRLTFGEEYSRLYDPKNSLISTGYSPEFGSSINSPFTLNQNSFSESPLELYSEPTLISVGIGLVIFDVNWSATFNKSRKLIAHKIDEINYIDTEWQGN